MDFIGKSEMEWINRKERIDSIQREATSIWFMVANNNDKHRGHPGISGPSSDPKIPWSLEYGTLLGTIATLQEVCEKIKQELYNKI